jgi:Tfp pilus assembly protein PilF
MKHWAVLLVSVIVTACASAPVAPPPTDLFNDQLFARPSERIDAADVFAVSDAMRRYLSIDIAEDLRSKGLRQGLIEALYKKAQLQLEYDSVMTGNAAQTFAARSGNCLSLVIMAAAFAKELGLPVQFQRVIVEESVSRIDDTYFFIGHVNVSLGPKTADIGFSLRNPGDSMTIDFLPPQETQALRSRPISEATIVAMYMNNRAAETLARGQLDDAYWWARAAIAQDPGFVTSYNTLGVIYRRHGNLGEARRALSYALDRDPWNTHTMSNLVPVLNDLGRTAEATIVAGRLEQLDPNPAFRYFNLGLQAMREGDYKTARDLLAKEVDRAPYYHEFHFWLALAYVGLGETEKARQELAVALKYSTTRKEHDLYAAKLDRIKASKVQ